ncbi:hypothetical protein FHS77_000095 [Paenochrobactrum gallinarii]|uniref:DUF945 domain-containing protein n=1 Tax=Paenochrobactrum gallinarii TaxID=643673 RepID=A0A841LSY5_9HYPH|nr:hypothetical protein [Paenochrobactrum gallinarii]MBB6259587.1 hypothetical protein [Paenochrobactrum gallinarii]
MNMKYFISATAASLLMSTSAFALDANAVAERIKSLYSKQGAEISFTAAEGDATAINLRGVKVALTSMSDEAFEVGDVTMKNVEETKDGGYRIGELIIPDISADIQDEGKKSGKLIIEGATSTGFTIPAENAKSALDKMSFYDTATIKKIEIIGEDDVSLLMEDINAAFSNKDGKKIDYSWNVGRIHMNLENIEKDGSMPDLGMNELNATITSNGTWLPESGVATLDKFDADIKDLGKLSMTTEIGGYDLAFVEAVQKTQEEMLAAGTDDAAGGLAILGLAEQLTIKDIAIRFEDQSLTNKLFDHYAKAQGTEPQMLREQAKMLVPLMAMQLNNPEFAESVKVAAEKYFDDPKSFTLKASPDKAVSVASLVATAAIDPTKIIQLLKVSISAND